MVLLIIHNISSACDTVEGHEGWNTASTHRFWSSPAVWIHRGEALSDYGIFRLTNQL